MKQSLEKVLAETKIMIADGAMATELENMGCDLNDSLWSAKVLANNPELMKKVHKSYFEAGADCGISGSYQATIEGFVARGYSEEESENLIKKAVEILAQSREEWWEEEGKEKGRVYPVVSASVGPYGAYLADGSEYVGGYKIGKEELKTFHKKRLKLLWEAGADILAVETIPCLDEAVAVAELINELGDNSNCWISFSCKNSTEISDGTSISECAKILNDFDCVKAIGINCTAPEYVGNLIKEVVKNTEKPVIVYPNSGEEYDPITKTWSGGELGKTYLEFVKEWIECGAKIVGGCCKTTPRNIKDIYNHLRN